MLTLVILNARKTNQENALNTVFLVKSNKKLADDKHVN